MNKMVIKIEPWVMVQYAYVYNSSNEVIKTIPFKLQDFSSFVNSFDDIDEVKLIGNKSYLSRYSQKAQELGVSKYKKNIKITIVGERE